MTYQLLFLVSHGNARVLTATLNTPNAREDAKRNAARWLEGDPDHYTVSPLSNTGDRIHLDITLQV